MEQVADYAIYLLDPQGRVQSWNAGAARLKGYRAEEVIGESFARFYTPEDRERGKPEEGLRGAREAGRFEEEGWRQRKDGSRFWAHAIITALRGPRGQLRGFAKVTRDATERRRLSFLGEASDILASSLDYETTLSRIASLCVPFLADWSSVQLVDAGGLRTVAVEHANPDKVALARELNRRFPEDQANGATWRAIRTGAPELFQEITEPMLEAAPLVPEHRERLKQLGIRSAMVVPLLVRGTPLGALTLVAAESGRRYFPEDLEFATELGRRCGQAIENARAHAQVQIEREFLEAIVQQMGEGVLVVEAPHGNITLANGEALRIFGCSRVEELARGRIFYDARGKPVAIEDLPVGRALRTGANVPLEELSFHRGGELRTLSVAAAPVRDRAGRAVGAVATFRDVTERKRGELQAAQEAADRELFFGILSHDLRNPLSAIVTGAHVLLRKGLPPEDARVVGRVATSAERMTKLISDLLDLTRSRLAGGIPINRSRVDLGEICRRAVEEVSSARPGCEIRFESSGSLRAQADPDRIAQVLSNLVGNAADYGCAQVRVSVRAVEGGVEIAVHNDGDPVPPELLPVLFDPFRRAAQRGHGGNPQGLGLGLFIAREIVERHGGSITVNSDAEHGTTFRVRLPTAAHDEAANSSPAP